MRAKIFAKKLDISTQKPNFFFKKHDFFLEVSLGFSIALDSFLVESNP